MNDTIMNNIYNKNIFIQFFTIKALIINNLNYNTTNTILNTNTNYII